MCGLVRIFADWTFEETTLEVAAGLAAFEGQFGSAYLRPFE